MSWFVMVVRFSAFWTGESKRIERIERIRRATEISEDTERRGIGRRESKSKSKSKAKNEWGKSPDEGSIASRATAVDSLTDPY